MAHALKPASEDPYYASKYVAWQRRQITRITGTEIHVVDDLPRPLMADRLRGAAWIRSGMDHRYVNWLLSELGRYFEFGPEAVPNLGTPPPRLYVVGGAHDPKNT
jgi:hypothetical protein